MSYKVDNAIILAAGTASRFAPLSYEMPKALIPVKGEVLIERQIRQLQEAGIHEIIVVVGYKKEQFSYLQEKYGVILVENNDYLSRNNNASIYAVKDYLKNTYICSSDNYFAENPFTAEVEDSYYAAVYSEGDTSEWCLKEDDAGFICEVSIGGKNAWYMLGHTFWSNEFSQKFLSILEDVYALPETQDKLWESIYIEHLDVLKMKLKKYNSNVIFEFDTLDELRMFDPSYIRDTKSAIMKKLAKELQTTEDRITHVTAYKTSDNSASGFHFQYEDALYEYTYATQEWRKL